MSPEALEKLTNVLMKSAEKIVDLESRVAKLEKEVMRLQVKELSQEMKGLRNADIQH